jgi:hypothetical protein
LSLNTEVTKRPRKAKFVVPNYFDRKYKFLLDICHLPNYQLFCIGEWLDWLGRLLDELSAGTNDNSLRNWNFKPEKL